MRGAVVAGVGGLVAATPRLAWCADALAPATNLIIGKRILEVNGKAATVFALQQENGARGINLAAGERFRVNLSNQCGEGTIIHWHGQTPPYAQDGVVDHKLAILNPGE